MVRSIVMGVLYVCLSVSLSVCLSVCLSVRWYISKTHVQISRDFPYMLRVAMARSSSDDNVIRYVLPVLLEDVMFSHNGADGAESYTRLFDRIR